MLKAMILAAGLGSRLKHKTTDKPKALIEIMGKPIIGYQLKTLVKRGITGVIIVVGYKGELIRNYVENAFPELKVVFVENSEYATTNSSYSFWKARKLLIGQNYLHLNCDIIFSFELLDQVIRSGYGNAIAVRKDLTLSDRMENVVLDGDKIIEMSINNTSRSVGKAFGLAKLSSESTDFIVNGLEKLINNGDKNQHYYGLIRQAVKKLDYRAVVTNKYNLQEINTLADYDATERILSENEQRTKTASRKCL